MKSTNTTVDVPAGLWEPVERTGVGWYVLGARRRLLGRLPRGLADTADEARTEYLRRNPILAARLSPEDREQVRAVPERAA